MLCPTLQHEARMKGGERGSQVPFQVHDKQHSFFTSIPLLPHDCHCCFKISDLNENVYKMFREYVMLLTSCTHSQYVWALIKKCLVIIHKMNGIFRKKKNDMKNLRAKFCISRFNFFLFHWDYNALPQQHIGSHAFI